MAQLAPDILFTIGSFPITNTVLNTIAIDGVIFGTVYAFNKNFKKIPGMFQNALEYVVEIFYDLTKTIAGIHTEKIFPYFMSFFLFILLMNWSGLIPGHGSFGIKDHEHLIPIFRNGTSDLNVTLALTIISLSVTHYYALTTVGIKDYLSRYFSFNPINLFVGILEIISEIIKLISLSFRLFGNIFAGEILLLTIGSIFAFLLPIPFMMLEVIVGLVQALVFSMLTMVFMSILMTSHHEGAHN